MRTALTTLLAFCWALLPCMDLAAADYRAVIAAKKRAAGNDSPGTGTLAGYWKLGDGGPTWVDSTGTTDLTENGTITAVTGKVENAADFESSDGADYLSGGDTAALEFAGSDFTIAGWVNVENIAIRTIVAKYNTTGNQREYALRFNNTPNPDVFQFIVSNDGTATNILSASTHGAPSTGSWYFVVAYHDNGTEIGISVNDGAFDTAAHTTGVFAGSATFCIGAWDTGNYWDGQIDEVGIWNRLLTAAEITWLYNSGNGRTYEDL